MLPAGVDEATIKAAVAEAMGRRRSAVLVFVTVVAIAQIRTRHICKRPHGGSLKGGCQTATSEGLRARFK
jgi:hypothetical protein